MANNTDNLYRFISIGSRKIQEDAYEFFEFKNVYKKKIKCIFVFDGHGAKTENTQIVSLVIDNKVFRNIFTKFFKRTNINSYSLYDFFNNFDDDLKHNALKNFIFLGMCISGIIICEDYIYVINIGDARTVVFSPIGKIVYKTPIHDFHNETELKRYEKDSRSQLIINKRYKGLSMSRVLGDFDVKSPGDKSLIPTPEICKIINNRELVILLNTDGLKIPKKKIFEYYIKNTLTETLSREIFNDNVCVLVYNHKIHSELHEKVKVNLYFSHVLDYYLEKSIDHLSEDIILYKV